MGKSQPSLGFLTALEDEQGAFVGGYLVTNHFGRPLEFQCTTPVRPNRPQRVLYGSTLRPYVMGELIGLALVEKTQTKADLLFTDQDSVLALRHHLDVPLVQVEVSVPHVEPRDNTPPSSDGALNPSSPNATDTCAMPSLICRSGFEEDRVRIETWYRDLDLPLDLAEPFSRIREALVEAQQSNGLR